MSEMTIKLQRSDMIGHLLPGAVPADTLCKLQHGALDLVRADADMAVWYDRAGSCFYRVVRVLA